MLEALQFGHAWAAWMDEAHHHLTVILEPASIRPRLGSVDGRQADDSVLPAETLQFGHAWAAWMDPPRLLRPVRCLTASIRPRLGSVDGRGKQGPCSRPCGGFNSATPGQRGWTAYIGVTYVNGEEASIRPRLGSVDGLRRQLGRGCVHVGLQFGHAWAAWMDIDGGGR